VDAPVGIEGPGRPGLERLLRYCVRPPFVLEHLQQLDAELLACQCPKPRPGGPSNPVLTPLALIDKIAALGLTLRTHRHRHYGVLAPHAPLRAAVTALAPVAARAPSAPLADAAEAKAERRHRAVSR
jgi:Putative transposase